jgi:hypothetical protein
MVQGSRFATVLGSVVLLALAVSTEGAQEPTVAAPTK